MTVAKATNQLTQIYLRDALLTARAAVRGEWQRAGAEV